MEVRKLLASSRLKRGVTGKRSNQDLICLVKVLEYIGYSVHNGS